MADRRALNPCTCGEVDPTLYLTGDALYFYVECDYGEAGSRRSECEDALRAWNHGERDG